MFQNSQIALEELPSVDEIDWQPLHESQALQMFIARLFLPVIISAVWIATMFIPNISLLPHMIGLPLVGVFSILFLGWPFIAVKYKGYASREKDICYKTGVIFAKVTAIPFNRIQHVETSHGPLDRKFGTASLQLFTAGGSSGDLHIHGLDAETAETMRAFILNKIGGEIEQD